MMPPQRQNIKEVFEAALGLQMAAGVFASFASLGIDSAAMQAHTFYLPQYPARSVCRGCAASCASFIDVINMPELTPDCDSDSFTDVTKTLMVLPLGGLVNVPFSTEPDEMSSVSAGTLAFKTDCPRGFVVPEAPEDVENQWIPGTGCAVACRSPLWTDGEWRALETITVVMGAIGLPFIIFMLFTWLVDGKRRK